jgi:hypothetical protein
MTTQAPLYPWATKGMYKPHGKNVIHYPNYPDTVTGRSVHAEVTNNAEAFQLASTLNKQTDDMRREFLSNPKVTQKQITAEFTGLNKEIDQKLGSFSATMKKADAEQAAILPLLEKMRDMLSQRGKLRDVMDSAKLPTWTDWFESFHGKMPKDVTIRTIQRQLAERNGRKPVRKLQLGIDRVLLKEMRDTAYNARFVVTSIDKWFKEWMPKDKESLAVWAGKKKSLEFFVAKLMKDITALDQEIERRSKLEKSKDKPKAKAAAATA